MDIPIIKIELNGLTNIVNQIRNANPPCHLDIGKDMISIANYSERLAFINGMRVMDMIRNDELDKIENEKEG